MPKKKSWFTQIKAFFFPGTDEQERKLKKKKKKRWLFGWMRTTKRPPSLAAPSLSRERTENNAREQEVHQDLPVAAPAASEEAGASSTTSTGGVSLLTSFTSSTQIEEKPSEYSTVKIHLTHSQLVRHVEYLAAIKIQTAFRGYLARKALRALKGLVRLQAIIRGRAVRRQAVATLKRLQSIVNIQSHVCATRYQMAKEERQNVEDIRDLHNPKNEKLKVQISSQRRWDDSLLTKEEENAILLSKTGAMMRRNRVKTYSFNHRHSAELEDGRASGRLRYWLDEVPQKEEIKRVDTIGGKQQRLRSIQGQYEAMADSPAMAPRRSFHCKKPRARTTSEGRLDCIPAYMAATESARARVQSMSSPRLRPMQLDSYSDGDSPYKSKVSPMSSINSERTCNAGNYVYRRRSGEGAGGR